MSELDVNTKKLEAMLEKTKVIIEKKSKNVVLKGVSAFANTASIYTPPSMYSKSTNPSKEIADKFYTREIFYLPQIVKEKTKKVYVARYDEEFLRDGFLFKVKHYRWYNKKTIWKYFKSKVEAEEDAKIKLRGLMRVSWGMALLQFGEKIPANIKRLFKKCPLLSGYGRFSDISIVQNEDGTHVKLTNKFTPSQNFSNIALKMGSKASESKMKSELKKVVIELEKVE